MHRVFRRAVRCAQLVAQSLVFACLCATPAPASDMGDVSEAEFALLPQYCRDVRGYKELHNSHDRSAKWVLIMGEGFLHMHHYCWALIGLARAEKASVPAQTRNHLRENAVADMIYVIREVPKDFVMLPEIYSKMGQTELLLRHPAKAKAAFDKSISLKRDYWPPYFHWAEYLRRTGKPTEAKTIAEEGLKQNPKAKALQELLKALDSTPELPAAKAASSKKGKPLAASADAQAPADRVP